MNKRARQIKNLSELESAKNEHEQLLLGIDIDDADGEDGGDQERSHMPQIKYVLLAMCFQFFKSKD